MGYFGPLAVLPGFGLENGVVTHGFYPDLAEAIMSRIATHYEVEEISITWVEITSAATFYSDHTSGVFDVVFMSLFKTAMWGSSPRDEIWNFSCGLLTTEPIRLYVCPSALDKEIPLVLTSAETMDTTNTTVQYIGGGAQQAAAEENFPIALQAGNLSAAANLAALFDACENGLTDIIVELPDRITNSVSGFVLDSQPIATYHNTGAAFRLDK